VGAWQRGWAQRTLLDDLGDRRHAAERLEHHREEEQTEVEARL
jgi:hypothetical protein